MASAWTWLAGLAAVALVVGAGSSVSASDDDDGGSEDGMTRKQLLYWRLRQVGELTEDQRMFVMLTAYGEGRYSTAAHNGSASEREASRRAAENNPSIVQWATSCGVPLANLQSGSWSMFQFLAPYYAGTVREVFGDGGCAFADPTRAAGRLDLQIVLAIEHARDLQGYQGWRDEPTIGNLRIGWANPSFMGKLEDHPDRVTRYAGHARKVVPAWSDAQARAFLQTRLTRFPANPAAIFQSLANTPMPTRDPLS